MATTTAWTGSTRFFGWRPSTCLRCVGCHDRPGIYSFRSYTGGDYQRGPYYLPDLQENRDAHAQANITALRKRKQYSWGLLQGLWEDKPGREVN
jgi:hypothetical protein